MESVIRAPIGPVLIFHTHVLCWFFDRIDRMMVARATAGWTIHTVQRAGAPLWMPIHANAAYAVCSAVECPKQNHQRRVESLTFADPMGIPYDITTDDETVRAFCDRWRVRELSLFGSVLSERFRSESDVDVLISFEPDAPWSAFDLVTMQEELEALFGRPVDLVEKEGLRNPYRRHAILSNREILYGSG